MALTPDLLRRIPMFNGLPEPELFEIMGCLSEVDIGPGEALYQEGKAAKSACFLVDGELEVVKALPGGGETEVGIIMPGTMIGEMALVAGGSRTATVRARRHSTVLKVSYHFFHAALSQMSVPAFKVLRAIIRILATRLDELQDRILQQWDCDKYVPSFAKGRTEEIQSVQPSFEFRPFLSVLPCLEAFSESEINNVLAETDMMEVPRGEFVYREGSVPTAAYLIVRGAIERSVVRDRRYQLSVLGPGRLSGGNALIAERTHTSDGRVRSTALLLRFNPKVFEGLFKGDTTCCMKFQNLISADQLLQLKAANNLLAQLVSQHYVQQEPRSHML